MKKTKLTNLIIIDASSSMSNKKAEVIGGLKELFSQIQKDAKKDKKTVTTCTKVVDFSSARDYRELVSSPDSLSLDESVATSYRTRGMTALYDAIGKSFATIPKQDSVFVNIITDGEENDSKEFTSQAIKKLIEEKRAEGWVITFMGTTEEAVNKAVSLGISKGNTMTYMDSAKGMASSFSTLNSIRSSGYFMSKQMVGGSLAEKTEIKKKLDNLLSKEKLDDNK